jgi:hypothetical protein
MARGKAARGSGALSGYADIVIEMRAFPKAGPEDRRRRLWAWSRYPETPRRLVIEWTVCRRRMFDGRRLQEGTKGQGRAVKFVTKSNVPAGTHSSPPTALALSRL